MRAPAKEADEVVRLRRWTKNDIAEMVVVCQDPELARWMPLLPVPYAASDAREFISHDRRGWGEGRLFAFAIVARDGGRLLGGCSVRRSESGAIGEIGYYVRAGERRRGVGLRALRLLAGWSFAELGIVRLQITVIVGNVASARLAERAGFRLEGTLRSWIDNRGVRADALMYSLLLSDLAGAGV